MKQRSFKVDWITIALVIILIIVVYLYRKVEKSLRKNLARINLEEDIKK